VADLERRLAEFWLDFDRTFKGHRDPEVGRLAMPYGTPGTRNDPRPGYYWMVMCDHVERGARHSAELPLFVERVRPMAPDVERLAALQLEVFDAHAIAGEDRVQAFVAFGEGRLRSGVHQHVMDKVDAANEQYHAWFGIARAAAHYPPGNQAGWLTLAGLVGMAFEIHWTLGTRSGATPRVSPGGLAALRAKWQIDLPAGAVSEEKLDLDFWKIFNG
jgi:hypothetical protein